MATKRPASIQNQASNSMGRRDGSSGNGNMGTNSVNSSSETAFVSFLILLTLLFFIILPFELYLYIIVKDAVEMCYKAKQ